ncbi:MAG: polyribonucleotide nucleotidyltransferase [Deltaproteobacteria bacterium]|nr:polyribonucleotide nucleotidyltransferase [Deltaproteobacteria bacterium]
METCFETEIGGRILSLKSGGIAKQASGSVVVQYGETIVLVTAVAAKDPKPDISFLPLSVEYQEKIYAAGRIPGNYFRREIGRPSEKETLTARLTDRPIRPLFPKGYNHEIQIIATVLSMDKENDPDILAMIGASAALEISDIPFDGPIASVRVGRIDGELVINPTIEQTAASDINIIIAGSKTGITMVEGGGDIVSESEMIEAIFFGHEQMQAIIEIGEKLTAAVGKPKHEFISPKPDQALVDRLTPEAVEKFPAALAITDKLERKAAVSAVKAEIFAGLGEEFSERKKEVSEILGGIQKDICRKMILDDEKRIDNRRLDEVRPISCQVGLLPRTHGSALFTRGETQVLSVLALGSGRDDQRIETLNGMETRAFMLHYNFPPYSVAETKRVGGPSRRDIGHGALARRAITRILPKEGFDYTIRLVAEVLESNGSSSMGTVCSSSMALMDGGVPVSAPVSGIAMGLISDGERIKILSDILGDEDHFGDMDFKVAGTKDGISALQMDIKIKELSREIMEKALDQAKVGRLHILEKMAAAISMPKKELSKYAPSITTVQISPDKIGDIIGPGGKNIRAIQADTNTAIEIDDTGLVKITSSSKEECDAAVEIVKEIGTPPEIGQIIEGTVVRITDFGAFVQIKPKTDGLVHISELANYRVKSVTDVVKEGEKLTVKVIDISRDGKIRLSHKATLEGADSSDGRSDGRRPDNHRSHDSRGQNRNRPDRPNRDK